MRAVAIVPEPSARDLPRSVSLAKKDRPILLASIEAGASHLVTGDLRDFGAHLGKRVFGVLVTTPGDYLRGRK